MYLYSFYSILKEKALFDASSIGLEQDLERFFLKTLLLGSERDEAQEKKIFCQKKRRPVKVDLLLVSLNSESHGSYAHL
ncbi:MAG: hypothetical protein BGO67_03100 [Alphaproteobacteria bacterium 41-28]|nr:MAG: hypothetical protein BGO67_03100 [Alphaproteobacteria bacterium 41-28]